MQGLTKEQKDWVDYLLATGKYVRADHSRIARVLGLTHQFVQAYIEQLS